MKKNLVTPAMLELRAAITEAEDITARPEISKRDEQRVNVLLAKIATLRSAAVATDDYAERWFKTLFRSTDEAILMRGVELRTDIQAGTAVPSWSQGPSGGYLVPQEFHDKVLVGMAQIDPLLDDNVVTLISSTNYSLKPYTIPGWNLATFKALKVSEGGNQNVMTAPVATNVKLNADNNYIYRATLDDTFEFEEDSFISAMDLITKAFKAGMARGIGEDLITGNGSTAPQGIVTGAQDSGFTTAGAGAIVADDIESIYFSVNEAYRVQPKAGWVMSDTIYQQVRKAKDTANRPLLSVSADGEVLMGKRVYVSPTMPSTAGSKGIVFGDLSYYCVRVSRMEIQKSLNAAQGGADFGKYLYTGRMRADAKVLDPTGGATSGLNSPIKYATLHA